MPFNWTPKKPRITRYVLNVICFFSIAYSATSQTIKWEFLPEGTTTGACQSLTNYSTGDICYGIEYVPGTTGTMTSYTMGFFVECPQNFSPNIISQSCTLTDNTEIIDACAQIGQIFMQASGNNASFPIIAGEPILIHQVCLNFHFLDSIDIIIDPITAITVSIDGPGGTAVTDTPPFDDFNANYGVFEIVPCGDTTVCSISLGLDENRVVLDSNALGRIVEGIATSGSDEHTQSFDVYDEENLFCSVAGGKDDIEISLKMIHTYDVNGHGLIDSFAGAEMYLEQDTSGLICNIPFGESNNNQSSSGDVRGYEMRVDYANHLSITAGQVRILLQDFKQANTIFESAAIVFYGPERYPYGSFDYQGYFNGTADLSGNCMPTAPASPFTTYGDGVITLSDPTSVQIINPCSPNNGSSILDTLILGASVEGGLHPDDIITGFSITVLGEDIAAPNLLDDGSNTGGEDNVIANRETSTQTTLRTSVLGYLIDGCVFADSVRASYDIQVSSEQSYMAIGDTVQYDIAVINKEVNELTPVDLEVILPNEIINIISGPGGSIMGQEVSFPNLSLARLDTNTYYVKGALSPTAPLNAHILDIVEGISSFSDRSYHHTFLPWTIDSSMPRSGVQHWYAPSDTALLLQYLNIDQIIIPSDSTLFSFFHKYDTELHKDGGQVEISTDNGFTWQSLGPHFISNGYNDYINDEVTNPAFSGNSNVYIHSTIDLSSFTHQTAFIRFKGFSDGEGKSDGWYVDDIEISNLRPSINNIATAYYQMDSIVKSLFPPVEVVLCNDVYSTEDAGQGTLRRAVSCAKLIDTIFFLPGVHNKTIDLNSTIGINKNLKILGGDGNITIRQNMDTALFNIISGNQVEFRNLEFLHPNQVSTPLLINEGNLILSETQFSGKTQVNQADVINKGTIQLDNTNSINKQ